MHNVLQCPHRDANPFYRATSLKAGRSARETIRFNSKRAAAYSPEGYSDVCLGASAGLKDNSASFTRPWGQAGAICRRGFRSQEYGQAHHLPLLPERRQYQLRPHRPLPLHTVISTGTDDHRIPEKVGCYCWLITQIPAHMTGPFNIFSSCWPNADSVIGH